MGVILSTFRNRKRKTTLEKLESLEFELHSIETYSHETEVQHQRVACRLLLLTFSLYVVLGLLFYFFFFRAPLYDQLLFVIPLIILLVLTVFLRRLVSWWYRRKILKNQRKLFRLRSQKKQLLEEIMDKETFKVARLILEKYAPDQLRRSMPMGSSSSLGFVRSASDTKQVAVPLKASPPGPVPVRATLSIPGASELRQREAKGVAKATEAPLAAAQSVTNTALSSPLSDVAFNSRLQSSQLRLIRPIVPQSRSLVEKLIEMLVGDSVNQRYALICNYCHSHNGMAMKEEFEYLSFRCCFCFHWNPARKQRPHAPRLQLFDNPRVIGKLGESPRTSDDNEEFFNSNCEVASVSSSTREQNLSFLSCCSQQQMNECSEEHTPVVEEESPTLGLVFQQQQSNSSQEQLTDESVVSYRCPISLQETSVKRLDCSSYRAHISHQALNISPTEKSLVKENSSYRCPISLQQMNIARQDDSFNKDNSSNLCVISHQVSDDMPQKGSLKVKFTGCRCPIFLRDATNPQQDNPQSKKAPACRCNIPYEIPNSAKREETNDMLAMSEKQLEVSDYGSDTEL